jgi:NAD(P)-dependent dehydrogenase (short-subunit alcohol dehydrogenase family)
MRPPLLIRLNVGGRSQAARRLPIMQRILITGANRGLGLEFTRCYLQRGDHVFAGCRKPSAAPSLHALQARYPQHLSIVALDVADADAIRTSHRAVHSQTERLDILINNAGVYSSRGSAGPLERLGELSFEDALMVLRVNAVAPLLVAQQFLDLLRAAGHAKIINISSGYGSVSGNTGGFPYYYSASKAALNMFMRSLAVDAKRWGITTVLLDPGWVSTDMGGPAAPVRPEEAVRHMIRLIDSLTPRHNGRFLTWRGDDQDW